jgi:hypothetical protein
MDINKVVSNPVLLEVGRRAIEDTLVSFRDARISVLNRNNGLVIRERNGTASDIIRLGPEDALRIGLKAIIKFLNEGSDK